LKAGILLHKQENCAEETMRRCWLAVVTLIGLREMASAADPQTVARIANYAAADRQAMLEAGARKEGEILVYAVGAQIDPVVKAFGAKYPYLTPKVFKGDIPVLLRKVTEEFRAGVHNVDAFELDDYGLEILRDARMLTPFTSPEATNYAPESIEAKRHWVFMREDYASLGFNTNSYAPDQVPQTYADLLDPKWKGKLGVSATESTLTVWVGAVVVSQGEAFFRKLGAQNLRLYGMGGRAVSNLVVSGEVPIVVNSRYSHMFASRKDGAKVSWRALGPSYTAVSGVAIPIRSKNPHAAMLFADFMLSADAQKIYADDLGYASLRKDMPNAAAPATKLYLALRPNYKAEYEQWGRLADQVLRAGR
jgi:iron(III) transport system substrate-binding protein